MKPIDYLTSDENFIYKCIKDDIKNCKNINDLKLLESKLDVLLERSISRFRVQNGIKNVVVKKQYEYSKDEIIEKANEMVKNGHQEEDIREKYNLTDDDMDLIDFVSNEL
ncbi:hypothetical protein AWH56_018620 [Anaerobacillus isosaccharinicus]|uniref:Uncharacterized protein n=1 Tax=Anaerobacillus isosaccharinicus TaxID=1532552 RepID=A0A1S2LH88_9BACI|nr:hypothetical protein [Anaerobacillus isosaccharinicus]MBA5587081.1 hypothetical protein [Anaerobacillus isosaccharinicus]QOY34723.1 hypothetical protein AWH56_018620 [Anaerobacillus isosaccharinicus]